jgi:hypothetical protein
MNIIIETSITVIDNKKNSTKCMTVSTKGAGTLYLSGAP